MKNLRHWRDAAARPGRLLLLCLATTALSACGGGEAGGGNEGAQSSAPIEAPSAMRTMAAASPPTVAIRNTDILLEASGSMAFADAAWHLQCNEFIGNATTLKGGVMGKDYQSDAQVLQFGRVTVPKYGPKPVLMFRAQADGKEHGGSPRCELGFKSHEDRLPRQQPIWHAYSIWINGNQARALDRVGISQYHHGVPGAELSPPFILVAEGDKLYADLRHGGGRPVESAADVVTEERKLLLQGASLLYDQWLDIVIRARLSPDADGEMDIWINGRLLHRYAGPIGYRGQSKDLHERVVHGLYPLVKGLVPFDDRVPVRWMFLKRSLVVADPHGSYNAAALRRALNQ